MVMMSSLSLNMSIPKVSKQSKKLEMKAKLSLIAAFFIALSQ